PANARVVAIEVCAEEPSRASPISSRSTSLEGVRSPRAVLPAMIAVDAPGKAAATNRSATASKSELIQHLRQHPVALRLEMLVTDPVRPARCTYRFAETV